MNNPSDGKFPQTRWSLVLSARELDSAMAVRALSELCEVYWFPIYVYVRRRGYQAHDAEDLTQGFFASLIRRKAFANADSERGKLRSYLLGCLKHFLSDEKAKADALKRGGQATIVSYDALEAEQRYQMEPRDEVSPEVIYEKRWAATLLNNVTDRLRAEYEEAGKVAVFSELQTFLTWGSDPGAQAEAAAKLGITGNAVRLTVLRMRKRYALLVREVIADTVSTPEEVEEEITYLFGTLRAG